MKILLTGANGYIGKRLIRKLISEKHHIYCCVRDRKRFYINLESEKLHILELDFLNKDSLRIIPNDIDVAFYLIHSMASSTHSFNQLEQDCAHNFKRAIRKTNVKQVIYLSGITNAKQLSSHLESRKNVENIIQSNKYHVTTLRAGIIIGSGSASFEILRDLVEKLPVMITPKWLNTRCQPIAISNVLDYLVGVMMQKSCFNMSYDIGGPDVLTYKEMLMRYAKIRKLKRYIYTIPIMTPKLSSYWLYFVTSTSYQLAINLVNSMKVEVVCEKNNLNDLLVIPLINYNSAIKRCFATINNQDIPSSWTDALTNSTVAKDFSELRIVPDYGCLLDVQRISIINEENVINKIWNIGGKTGWYYGNWLWRTRGFVDKLFFGVGLRRGRRNTHSITAGETLDFWRVIDANKKEKRLLLFAEMKLPGEAWLEFKIKNNILIQTATFRPHGLSGRIYWYLLIPIHKIIFKGMIRKISL
tara:strand:- start:43 stop:1458 length:1416 start_codon:yes stop_codon:yes gene_type:complete